jgi:hypothetical protein
MFGKVAASATHGTTWNCYARLSFTLKLAVHVMYGGRAQPTRETSETDAIPYIRWQHMIVSAVKFRPPLRFLVLVLARAMCRTASKCFATFRLCGRGLVSAESYLTAQHATC